MLFYAVLCRFYANNDGLNRYISVTVFSVHEIQVCFYAVFMCFYAVFMLFSFCFLLVLCIQNQSEHQVSTRDEFLHFKKRGTKRGKTEELCIKKRGIMYQKPRNYVSKNEEL